MNESEPLGKLLALSYSAGLWYKDMSQLFVLARKEFQHANI